MHCAFEHPFQYLKAQFSNFILIILLNHQIPDLRIYRSWSKKNFIMWWVELEGCLKSKIHFYKFVVFPLPPSIRDSKIVIENNKFHSIANITKVKITCILADFHLLKVLSSNLSPPPPSSPPNLSAHKFQNYLIVLEFFAQFVILL